MTDEPTLTIDHPTGHLTLRPGDVLAFGRAASAPAGDTRISADGGTSREGVTAGGSDDAHLGLSDNPRLHQRAGRIEVDSAGWLLANTGRWLHLRVIELDGPNRLDLQPGRLARIPYPWCRVEITTGDESVGFDVTCPFLDRSSAVPEPAQAGSTVQGLGLDRRAGYFRALVALCAPRLRDPQSDEVATVGEIVRALNRSSAEPERVTAKAVERRLAHVRSKLAIGAADPFGGSAAGLEVRDAARVLADLVLRTGAVTVADLDLLDDSAVAPPPAPGGPA
jgi:hypothetical protein